MSKRWSMSQGTANLKKMKIILDKPHRRLGWASRYLLLGFVPQSNLHDSHFFLSAKPNEMAEDRTVPDFSATIILYAGQFSGGDKPHPYLFGETSFVVAGFIPAFKMLQYIWLEEILGLWGRLSKHDFDGLSCWMQTSLGVDVVVNECQNVWFCIRALSYFIQI